MTGEQLFRYIGDIDDSYIIEAESVKVSNQKSIFIRWSAVAACAVLLIAAIPMLKNIMQPKGDPSGLHGNASDPPGGSVYYDYPSQSSIYDNDGLDMEEPLFEMNGCYYQMVRDPDILQKLGLPQEISPDMAGGHVAYLTKNGPEYSLSSSATDIEMLTFEGHDSRAVYIVREGNELCAAAFCNFLITSDASVELKDLYSMYGIESASDISSITEVGWDRSTILLVPKVTDEAKIAEFYEMTEGLISYSNDEFQEQMFGSTPEEDQQVAHNTFSDSLRIIRVETSDGLFLYLNIYPSSGWVYGNGSLSYYRIDDALKSWLDSELSI